MCGGVVGSQGSLNEHAGSAETVQIGKPMDDLCTSRYKSGPHTVRQREREWMTSKPDRVRPAGQNEEKIVVPNLAGDCTFTSNTPLERARKESVMNVNTRSKLR